MKFRGVILMIKLVRVLIVQIGQSVMTEALLIKMMIDWHHMMQLFSMRTRMRRS